MAGRLSLAVKVEPATPEDGLLESTLPVASAHRDGDARHVLERIEATRW